MRLPEVVFILLASAAATINAQLSPAARAISSCGLINNKIYCYAGSTGTRDELKMDTVMFTLDISKAIGTSMSEFENSWAIQSPNTAGVDTHSRRDCQYAVVGSQLVLSGGSSMPQSGPALVHQTIAYNADDNTWKSYPNYVDGNFGNRQIYYASTSVVPSKGLAFYGGYERPYNPNWKIDTDQNFTATVSGNYRAVGYMSVVYLDITNTNNPWSTPPQTNVPTTFSARLTSIYDATSSKIFFFGGTYEDTLNPGYGSADIMTYHKLSYALMFDTSNGAWGNQTLTGNVIPTERRYHTTTLLPNGQSTVLLYGGERKSAASMDFCFTLDLKSFTWTQLNINVPAVDLRRAQHSAVLVNNETLFIVMGFNGVNTVTSLPIVLNIADPSNITYVEKYTDPNAQEIVEKQSSGLSSGAIAGIAVGVTVGGIVGFAAIFFCLRKKKAEAINRDQGAAQYSTTQYQSQEAIVVDWDEIESQYREMPAHHKPNESYPSSSYANISHPSAVTHEDDHTTVVGNAERYNASGATHIEHNSKGSTVPHTSPTILKITAPFSLDSPDQVRQPYITKPDGGSSL